MTQIYPFSLLVLCNVGSQRL